MITHAGSKGHKTVFHGPWLCVSARLIGPLCLFLILVGCGTALGHMKPEASADAPRAVERGLADRRALPQEFFADQAAATFNLAAAPPMAAPQEGSAPAPGERLIIYTAALQVKVSNLEEAKKKFLALVENRGGYLERQEDQTLTCRIPAERFNETLETVRGYGAVLKEKIQAGDVTRQAMDLTLRLENALQSRDRLLELLKRSDKVSDLLEVEKELKRLTEEIERLKGELRLLKDQVAYSTLQVTFNGPVPKARSNSRAYSRFYWINEIGVENVLERF